MLAAGGGVVARFAVVSAWSLAMMPSMIDIGDLACLQGGLYREQLSARFQSGSGTHLVLRRCEIQCIHQMEQHWSIKECAKMVTNLFNTKLKTQHH